MNYSFDTCAHFFSSTGPWADNFTITESEKAPLLYSDEISQITGENETSEVVAEGSNSMVNVPYFLQRRRVWDNVATSDRQRLHYQRRLIRALRQSVAQLPDTASQISQELLDAVLEFRPHQMGISVVTDEEQEASLTLTAYWPTATLHVEHFFHFPIEDPNDTVVNYYAKPVDSTQVSQREWGWYCAGRGLSDKLRGQLRSGQWPLAGGW